MTLCCKKDERRPPSPPKAPKSSKNTPSDGAHAVSQTPHIQQRAQELPEDLRQFAVLQRTQRAICFKGGFAFRALAQLVAVSPKCIKIQVCLAGSDAPRVRGVLAIERPDERLQDGFLTDLQRFRRDFSSSRGGIFDPNAREVQQGDAAVFTVPLCFQAQSGSFNLILRPEDADLYCRLGRAFSRLRLDSIADGALGHLKTACEIDICGAAEQFDVEVADIARRYVLVDFVNRRTGNTHRAVVTHVVLARADDQFVQLCVARGRARGNDVALDFYDACEGAAITCVFNSESAREVVQGFQRWGGGE